MPPEVKGLWYVAASQSWKEYQPCRALAVPSCLVFPYNVNATVDDDEFSMARRERVFFLRITIVVHFFMVTLQFLERAWPW